METLPDWSDVCLDGLLGLIFPGTQFMERPDGMYNETVRFEWDYEKADNNEREHNVSFTEAATVFDDDLSVALADPDHSIGEFRVAHSR